MVVFAGLNAYATDSTSELDLQIVAFAENYIAKTKAYKGKNQLLYFSQGEKVTLAYFWTPDQNQKISYFRWISKVAVNGRAPSLFLRQPNGSLNKLFQFQADTGRILLFSEAMSNQHCGKKH